MKKNALPFCDGEHNKFRMAKTGSESTCAAVCRYKNGNCLLELPIKSGEV